MARRHAGLLGNGSIRNRGDPICIAQLSRKEPFSGIFAPGVICLPTACFGLRQSLLTRMAECMLCRRSVHSLRLLGPPVASASRLARRLATLLPAMSLAEALETTRIPRVAGLTGGHTA